MISNDELYNIAETERRRLQSGGFTLNLKELQLKAREYAGEHNEQTEIAVFHVLEEVNDIERNRRLYDRGYHLFNAIGHNREVHRIDQAFQQAKATNHHGNVGGTINEIKEKAEQK